MAKPKPFGWIMVAKGAAPAATINEAVLRKVFSSKAAALAEAQLLWVLSSGDAEVPSDWEKIRDEWVVNHYDVRPIYLIDDAAVTAVKHVQNSMKVMEMMDKLETMEKLSTAMQMPKGRING